MAVAIALGALLESGPALAFCRSTTCAGACARDADGCKTEGHPLYWPGLCVGFSIQQSGSVNIDMADVVRVINASFVAWSDIDCGSGLASLAFSPAPEAACHKAEYDATGGNANIVMFHDTRWDYTDINNTLAKTTVTYDTDTGEIFDADIELNHAFNEFSISDEHVVYDLQSITTHEVGHFLGLDHTFDFAATMNAGYAEGTTELRSIETDDINGLCTAYPPTRAVTCDPEPRGGFRSTCAGEAESGDDTNGCAVVPSGGGRARSPALAGALAFLTLAWRRSRRARGAARGPRTEVRREP